MIDPIPLHRLIPAVVGDRVAINGPLFPEFVQGRCSGEKSNLFACLPCRAVIANRFNMIQHIALSKETRHVVVRRCPVHKAWEPAFLDQPSLFPDPEPDPLVIEAEPL